MPALAGALRTLATDPGRALGAVARGFPTWDEVTERVLADYARALLTTRARPARG